MNILYSLLSGILLLIIVSIIGNIGISIYCKKNGIPRDLFVGLIKGMFRR